MVPSEFESRRLELESRFFVFESRKANLSPYGMHAGPSQIGTHVLESLKFELESLLLASVGI